MRSDREVLGRCKGPLREVSEGYLPIVKAHKHWAQRTFREVGRLKSGIIFFSPPLFAVSKVFFNFVFEFTLSD